MSYVTDFDTPEARKVSLQMDAYCLYTTYYAGRVGKNQKKMYIVIKKPPTNLISVRLFRI